MQDVFICRYVRTPIGRYGGALSAVRTDDLAAHPLRALLDAVPGLDETGGVEDVLFGCANQAGEDNRNVARMAALLAGFPDSVAGVTLNRLCASGMDAVATAAARLACGEGDAMIAGGVESMSRAPLVVGAPMAAFARNQALHDTTIGWRFVNPVFKARFGTDSMPETAENLAEEQAVSRADQDAFAALSQARAERGEVRRSEEIAPVFVPQRKGDPVRVDRDEHPRPGTTAEALARLRAPFREGGTVTAGNASGVNDGAAALLLATRAGLDRLGLEPLARIVGSAVAGVAPRTMGIGPVPATRKLLARTGHGLDEVGVIELNEAFAAQAIAVLRSLGLADDDDRVNPNGGAIALGHPLGMSGARIVGTCALEMRRRGARLGLATLCVGVGQGMSVLLEAAE